MQKHNTYVTRWMKTCCFHNISYKNAFMCNGELYVHVSQKIYARFNRFDIKQSIAQTNKN